MNIQLLSSGIDLGRCVMLIVHMGANFVARATECRGLIETERTKRTFRTVAWSFFSRFVLGDVIGKECGN